MFNFRIISVCLGHLGVSRGGVGIGERRPWMPLTSNLFKSGNPSCNFFCFVLDLQDNRLCWSHFAFLNSSSLRWPDFCGGGGGGGGGNRTSLTLNPDLVCFLLGELVGFLPSPYPNQEVAASFLLPCKELGGTFHTSYSGMGLVCVWNTDVFSNSTLDCSGVGLYNFKECLDFPASCGLLLSYCTDCNIMLHVQDEQ